MYINCLGNCYACSFCEGIKEWKFGINIFDVSSFKNIWEHQITQDFRKHLLANNRNCPYYDLNPS